MGAYDCTTPGPRVSATPPVGRPPAWATGQYPAVVKNHRQSSIMAKLNSQVEVEDLEADARPDDDRNADEAAAAAEERQHAALRPRAVRGTHPRHAHRTRAHPRARRAARANRGRRTAPRARRRARARRRRRATASRPSRPRRRGAACAPRPPSPLRGRDDGIAKPPPGPRIRLATLRKREVRESYM